MRENTNLKDISNKIGLSTADFADVLNTSSSAINQLKDSKNPAKYEITTLGIMAKYLNLTYDDLVTMSNIKKSAIEAIKKENPQHHH